MMNFEGKTAVVTGGSRGLGRAVCLELAGGGANVALCYAGNEAAAQETAAAVEAAGGHALALRCDVCDAAQVDALFKAAAEEFGRVDILVNNAGITRDNLLLRMSEEDFDAVIAANVLHLLEDPEPAVRELWRVTAPGGRLILPTYLLGKAGAAYGSMIKIYQGVGFHYEHAFTPETYRMLLERLGLGPVTLEVIPGGVPEGIAVLEKKR